MQIRGVESERHFSEILLLKIPGINLIAGDMSFDNGNFFRINEFCSLSLIQSDTGEPILLAGRGARQWRTIGEVTFRT